MRAPMVPAPSTPTRAIDRMDLDYITGPPTSLASLSPARGRSTPRARARRPGSAGGRVICGPEAENSGFGSQQPGSARPIPRFAGSSSRCAFRENLPAPQWRGGAPHVKHPFPSCHASMWSSALRKRVRRSDRSAIRVVPGRGVWRERWPPPCRKNEIKYRDRPERPVSNQRVDLAWPEESVVDRISRVVVLAR